MIRYPPLLTNKLQKILVIVGRCMYKKKGCFNIYIRQDANSSRMEEEIKEQEVPSSEQANALQATTIR